MRKVFSAVRRKSKSKNRSLKTTIFTLIGHFPGRDLIDTQTLERFFKHHVLMVLSGKGKIAQDMLALLNEWRHTGFNVYCGKRIFPRQKVTMENPAKQVIRKLLPIPQTLAQIHKLIQWSKL